MLKDSEMQTLRLLFAYGKEGRLCVGDDGRHARFLVERGLANPTGANATYQITQTGREELLASGQVELFDRRRIHDRWCKVKESLEKRLTPCSRTFIALPYDYLQPWNIKMSLEHLMRLAKAKARALVTGE